MVDEGNRGTGGVRQVATACAVLGTRRSAQ